MKQCFFFFLYFSFLLSGCTQSNIASIEYRGDKFFGWGNSQIANEITTPPPATSSGNSREITVARGEGLYGIARKYHVNAYDLIQLNHLIAPYSLKVGQKLSLPTGQYHTVKPRETIAMIARQYHRSPADLIHENKLTSPYVIQTGQLLRIPEAPRLVQSETPVIASEQPIKSSSLSPLSSQKPVASDNHTINTSPVDTGSANIASAPKEAAPANLLPALPKSRITDTTSYILDKDGAALGGRPTAPLASSLRDSEKFIWPINGRVISPFGPQQGGIRNDGINIASPEGTPIKAAAPGTVVYAGNELRGYGNLVIIRHPEEFLTAYAHQKHLNVSKGAKVQQGQIIGYVGSSGNISQPQLHFGVRLGKKPVNPLDYLPQKQ